MAVITDSTGEKLWQLRTRTESLKKWLVWFSVLVVAAVAWRYVSANTQWIFVVDSPRQAADLFGRMVPPRISYIGRLWGPLWDTINIATLGTLVALVIAVPLAFLAARNTTPHPLFRTVALFIIAFSRSVNSLIWALMLVMIIGPGLLAGIIAIGIRAIGFISKLLYEAIEEVNREALEAITATGARRSQVIFFGVVPQILPALAGIAVFRWDVNIRESTVVGLVGAGGIGLYLNHAINRMAWPDAAAILIVIFLMVLSSEWVSSKARHAII